jgi:nucleotide-binding universal stress UspA family protein
MTDTILLGTDGSADAQRATGHAIAVAAREGATLHAVFVVDTRQLGEPALSSVELLIDEYEDRGWEILNGIETAAAEHGVTVETTCCHGDPAEEIRRLADAISADLIFLGRRGETHEKLPGKVSRKLSREDDRVIVTD